MLFGENWIVKLSVVGKIVRAIANIICQSKDNFVNLIFLTIAQLKSVRVHFAYGIG